MTADPNDATSYDDCGFDISHNNKGLDFALLSTTGSRKYCFVKLTEGSDFVDPAFSDAVAGIIAANVQRVGVYHFGHHGDPIGQMKFFVDTFVSETGSIANKPDFLFMLDLERGANPPLETDGLIMVQYLQSIGINPVIYCGFDFWSQNHPELATCTNLLAAYNNHPVAPIPWRIPSADVYGWDIWQYTGDSLGPWAKDIPGGTHGMDLSCFNLKKHPEGLAAWWNTQLANTTQPS
jgi:GH25 family lysozyme M1 (1,4-beta-N-acetylmuramidase)